MEDGPRARSRRRPLAPGRAPAGRARSRCWGSSTPCPAHVGQGRPRGTPVAAAGSGRPRPHRLLGRRGVARRAVAGGAGLAVTDRKADFFDLGGGSLAAAQLVSRIRARVPEFSVADIYDVPRSARWPRPSGPSWATRHRRRSTGGSDAACDAVGADRARCSAVHPLRHPLAPVPPHGVGHPAARAGFEVLPSVPWGVLVVGLLVFATPFGRMAIAVASARLLLAGVRAGDYPRGGWVHIRLWLAEQIADQVDAVGLAGAPWVSYYARALGARIGRDVDLHALPPVTGLLVVGDGASIEPEVDLTGYWIDGDLVRIGEVRIGAEATVGARSTLAPGTRIGRRAEIARVPRSSGGSRPTSRGRVSRRPRGGNGQGLAAERPPTPTRWLWAYAGSAVLLALLPLAAFTVGGLVLAAGDPRVGDPGRRGGGGLRLARAGRRRHGTRVRGIRGAARPRVLARAGGGDAPGAQPRGVAGVDDRASAGCRPDDPVPAVLVAVHPVWLRMLGARVGRDVEASTVLLCRRWRGSKTARSWPTTRWSPRTNCTPGGCGSGRCASASARSSATRAWRPRPPGAARRAGGGAVRRAAQGEGRIVVARFAGRAPAASVGGGRRIAHLPPTAGLRLAARCGNCAGSCPSS